MADIFKNVSHVPWSVLCAAVFYLFIALFLAASVVKYARKGILSFIVSTISRRRKNPPAHPPYDIAGCIRHISPMISAQRAVILSL